MYEKSVPPHTRHHQYYKPRMPSMLNSTPSVMRSRAVAQGRAMIRLIECAQVLLTNSGSWSESALLKLAIALYKHRLRQVIAVLPPE
jgi:hypothetical protein